MTKVQMLMPLTTSHWRADPTRPDEIIGQWAEDYSQYRLVVPHQLRNSIITLQHILCDRVNEIEGSKKQYDEAVKRLWEFVGE